MNRRTAPSVAFVAHLIDATEELAPGPNPLAIGYAWLKGQPEYVDATDA